MQIDVAMVAVLATIFIAILAATFGYGVLTQKVKANREALDEHRETYNQIYAKLDNISDRLKGVETQLKNGNKTKE